jgi:hypothetical protein
MLFFAVVITVIDVVLMQVGVLGWLRCCVLSRADHVLNRNAFDAKLTLACR